MPLKYTAQFAALLYMGLSLSCQAAPVTPENKKKTDETVIFNNITGEEVVYTKNSLSYRNKTNKWKKLISDSPYVGINEVMLYNKEIYVSTYVNTYESITKYSNVGKILWKTKGNAIKLIKIFPISHLLYTNQCSEPTVSCLNRYYDTSNGKEININGDIISERKSALLVYSGPYRFPPPSYLPEAIGLAETLLTETSYSVITPKGEILRQEFSTPARKSCGDYKPTIQELAYKEIIYGDNEGGREKLCVISKFFENIVHGDYIYAHRQDGCGKFTYRFHWTEPKNPGPVILQGWR